MSDELPESRASQFGARRRITEEGDEAYWQPESLTLGSAASSDDVDETLFARLQSETPARIGTIAAELKERLSPEQSAAFQTGLGRPSRDVNDKLWLIVVSVFAFVLVGSFTTLAVGVFVATKDGGVKPELVFATFTSVVGFLAGLFAPSPIRGLRR